MTGTARITLMIVDDNADLLDVIIEQVQDLGYGTVSATTGPEALSVIETQTVHGVVCDINMPRMSGIELLAAVRAKNQLTPFVFITGRPSVETVKEAIRLGAYDILRKPFEPEELEAAIVGMLSPGSISESFKETQRVMDAEAAATAQTSDEAALSAVPRKP